PTERPFATRVPIARAPLATRARIERTPFATRARERILPLKSVRPGPADVHATSAAMDDSHSPRPLSVRRPSSDVTTIVVPFEVVAPLSSGCTPCADENFSAGLRVSLFDYNTPRVRHVVALKF